MLKLQHAWATLLEKGVQDEWRLNRAQLEVAELARVLKYEEVERTHGLAAQLRWQGLEEGERPSKFLSRLLHARRVKQRWSGILDEDGLLV